MFPIVVWLFLTVFCCFLGFSWSKEGSEVGLNWVKKQTLSSTVIGNKETKCSLNQSSPSVKTMVKQHIKPPKSYLKTMLKQPDRSAPCLYKPLDSSKNTWLFTVHQPPSTPSRILNISFNPHGTRCVTTDSNGVVGVWKTDQRGLCNQRLDFCCGCLVFMN